MKKKTSRKGNGFFFAFLIVAAAFLAVGLGTLGSFHSLGDSYLLSVKQTGDTESPGVVFHLENPKDEEGKTVSLKLTEVYVNVAVIYSEAGVPARITIEHKSSSASSFSGAVNATLENFYTPEEGADGKPVNTTGKNVHFRFVMPFLPTSSTSSYSSAFGSGSSWYVSSYPYIRLTATGGVNVLLNEVVFVGVRTSEGTPTTSTDRYIIPARVDSATPYGDESAATAKARAFALTDDATVNYPESRFAEIENWKSAGGEGTAPVIEARKLSSVLDVFPNAGSSYAQFTKDEIYSLMTVAEMKQGATYYFNAEDTPVAYYADGVYGAFGTDFLALGTLLFGTSQFGLRFFPMLAVFGALVVLSRFTARLARSEKAGLAFAVLFALSSLAIGLGHTGTPFAIGLFFFACGLDIVHRFYANGLKRANFLHVLPLLFAGLFLAASICVQGAFVIPAAGVCALFICGVVRMRTAKKYALEKIEQAPEPAEPAPGETDGEPPLTKEERTAKVREGFRFRFTAAPLLFAAGLLVGALLFALIGMLPAYYTYQKVYDDLANPTMNVFVLAWRTFANGFTGSNPYAAGGQWDFLRTVFSGAPMAGDYLLEGNNVASSAYYAVTMYTVNWVAALAVLVGLAVAVVLIVLAFRKKDAKAIRISLRRLLIPVSLGVLALVAAAASPAASGFVALAWALGFALAAPVFAQPHEGRAKSAATAVNIAGLVLLIAGFALLAAFTFSVPLPVSLLNTIFG